MALAMLAATLLGAGFYDLGLETCIVITYVLAVLCVSLLTVGRLHCLVASALSVLLYNYFYTVPRFSLTAWGREYPATFAAMFLIGLMASTVAMTLRHELHASNAAYSRTRIILETDEALHRCTTREQIVDSTGAQLSRLLGATVIWYADDGSGFSPRRNYTEGDESPQEAVVELPMALRAREDAKSVGIGTPRFSSASGLYIPVRSGSGVAGVMGACLGGRALLPGERNEAEAVIGEASLALDRAQALEEREKSAVMAKNEQTRANLLRSISHDLRTPLTAISGNADVLLDDAGTLGQDRRETLLRDIRSDALWLNATVENLLSITRLENDGAGLSTTLELLSDIIEEALRHVSPDSRLHHISVDPGSDLLLVDVNAHLMVQVVVNIVNNAIAYTPEGSHIQITCGAQDGRATVCVSDDGPGIPEEDQGHVFESFYTVGHTLADSRRSVGLGLSLCKSIVEAHGGTIGVRDVKPHGCAFEFSLPLHQLEEGDADSES